ncbi:MAG: hypothetical protein RL043_994, partial [Pseudomonadota bacterium]
VDRRRALRAAELVLVVFGVNA